MPPSSVSHTTQGGGETIESFQGAQLGHQTLTQPSMNIDEVLHRNESRLQKLDKLGDRGDSTLQTDELDRFLDDFLGPHDGGACNSASGDPGDSLRADSRFTRPA